MNKIIIMLTVAGAILFGGVSSVFARELKQGLKNGLVQGLKYGLKNGKKSGHGLQSSDIDFRAPYPPTFWKSMSEA